jgi:hypothetical protein
MRLIHAEWLRAFDANVKQLLGIDRRDVGLSDEQLSRCADLLPRDAALQFGEDYDVQRVDIDWLT